MNLTGGYPFWRVRNGLVQAYPRLAEKVRCDVLIVGAGITGALIAHALTHAGLAVCVIERREAGWGSTSASTALLQYEIDVELQALAERYGLPDALLAYRACERAVRTLGVLAKSLRGVDFQRTHSLYLASHERHKARIEAECVVRQANGFAVELLDRSAVGARFGIGAPAALLTAVAAQVDPYRFAHRLLASVASSGGRVHARTALQEFRPVHGGVLVHTDDGVAIRCKHLVLAAGYETAQWLAQRVASNRSSYAFVSEPLPAGLGALQRTLVWETARPYLYMRSTADNRMLVGGNDDNVDVPARRDARIKPKSEQLLARARSVLPALPLKVAFAWAGTFAETEDGLPFFGCHAQHGPRVHFAMAYGGNGITYSQIGAEILRDGLAGTQHPCASLFGFGRLRRR